MELNGFPEVHLTLVGAGRTHCEKCIHGDGNKCGNHPTATRITNSADSRSPWEPPVVRARSEEGWLRTTDCLEAEATANHYRKIRELAEALVNTDMKSKEFMTRFFDLAEMFKED